MDFGSSLILALSNVLYNDNDETARTLLLLIHCTHDGFFFGTYSFALATTIVFRIALLVAQNIQANICNTDKQYSAHIHAERLHPEGHWHGQRCIRRVKKYKQLEDAGRCLAPFAVIQISKEVPEEALLILIIFWVQLYVDLQVFRCTRVLKAMVSAWTQDRRVPTTLGTQCHCGLLVQPEEHVGSSLRNMKLLCLVYVVMERRLNDRRAISWMGGWYRMCHHVVAALSMILDRRGAIFVDCEVLRGVVRSRRMSCSQKR